jgi:hypothetical protein
MSDLTSDLARDARARTRADLAYESLYCAAIGGSIVALFFLVFDAWSGRPLFTPSLMGGVLFGGVAADSVNEVRLDWVAYMTILHFFVFAVIGVGVTLVAQQVELHARHPATVFFTLFAAIEWVFLVGAFVALPGVLAVLGPFRVATANLLAAGGIATFLWASHRPEAWERLKHRVLLA